MELNKNIDDYFNGDLNKQEQDEFVRLLETDKGFAAEVALYLASRAELREVLLEEKRKQWRALQAKEGLLRKLPAAKPKKLGWWHYAAAACLLFAAFFIYQDNQTGPAQLAQQYVQTELGQLSQTMSGQTDSLQMGITAYNQKDYALAGKIFEDLYQNAAGTKIGMPTAPGQVLDSTNVQALKYAGFVSLATKNYDKAIMQFETLANTENVFANPGCFYQAIALLLRNNENDKEAAKKLLEKVVNEQLEGAETATKWLKKY